MHETSPTATTAGGTGVQPEPVLSLRGVSFAYESASPLIQGMTADLQPGRICVMLGPNAAGKSTLIRLMMGQLRPQAGQVLLAGQDIYRLKAAQRAQQMSYVPQRSETSFGFTVRQVVEMGRFALSPSPQAVELAIQACDLVNLEQRIYSQLSVGQQQRVLLARAMAQSHGDGRVMLLDEPGSAMDLRHTHEMMHTLTRLAAGGLAVLVVVHDLNVAARYADDIWLLHQGRLVAAGPWHEILEPERLSAVYEVKLRRLSLDQQSRPVFAADVP
jgi:iron complex transport system ATP-binding protein